MNQDEIVQLVNLPLPTLEQLMKQTQQQLKDVISKYQVLESAKDRFRMSERAVDEISTEKKDSKVLVPLTSHLFIPGTLGEVKEVFIDIGTNYYVKKDLKGAKESLRNKMSEITDIQSKLGESERKLTERIITMRNVYLRKQHIMQNPEAYGLRKQQQQQKK